jgi:3,5-epimerase/4-reductase
MNNKILIFGEGFIGSRLQDAFGCALSKRKIYSFKEAEEEVRKFSPKIIANCIGYIGRNVDDCELDKDKALISNVFVPVILGEVALRNKIRLIHISSGCIYRFNYSQDKPIRENKFPDFWELFYSRTKIYSEQALNLLANEYPVLIIRIRVPLDDRPHPRNILTKLIEYKKVIDIPNSITYIPDFIKALQHLIKIRARGIYNVVNKGTLRYPELLGVYQKYVPSFEYQIIDYKKLGLVRTNLILSTKKLEQTGFKIRSIKKVMEECVKSYLKY